MSVEDVDLREVSNVGDVKDDAADRLSRSEVKVGDLVDKEAKLAGFGGEEGVKGVGIVLGSVEGGANAANRSLVS